MSESWAEHRLHRALSEALPASSDFDLNQGAAPPAELRPAGVLAAFHEDDGRLVLTKRASGLRHHPGQIALPGGKRDADDKDEIATALREAQEEIGLRPDQVEVLGTLSVHRTLTGFAITPVIGIIRGQFTPRAEPGEVAEIFCLPFDHIAAPSNYRVEGRRWRNGWRKYYVAPYGPYYLWGATARILFGLAQRMQS